MYISEMTHQDNSCQGGTPMETFIEGKKTFYEKNSDESSVA